jgi:hypothetical protein
MNQVSHKHFSFRPSDCNKSKSIGRCVHAKNWAEEEEEEEEIIIIERQIDVVIRFELLSYARYWLPTITYIKIIFIDWVTFADV